jgi:hypothetical protein
MLIACMTGEDQLITAAAEDASAKEPESGPGVE